MFVRMFRDDLDLRESYVRSESVEWMLVVSDGRAVEMLRLDVLGWRGMVNVWREGLVGNPKRCCVDFGGGVGYEKYGQPEKKNSDDTVAEHFDAVPRMLEDVELKRVYIKVAGT
ncbi:hypothetical protein A0H81_09267 [Grifola frondosa]|uniref:Uncharacterized protein n=1 Tax=Grifola frondosa TaxID=5627 RepID=A0A1C7M227_GRIFR|nr:hypothetical protein A0H81_09267 [Grifola frondosa]